VKKQIAGAMLGKKGLFCAKTIVEESSNFELAHLKEEEEEEEFFCWLPLLVRGNNGSIHYIGIPSQ